jgi:hypothetical protein
MHRKQDTTVKNTPQTKKANRYYYPRIRLVLCSRSPGAQAAIAADFILKLYGAGYIDRHSRLTNCAILTTSTQLRPLNEQNMQMQIIKYV